jgi:CHAT domain-containing protein
MLARRSHGAAASVPRSALVVSAAAPAAGEPGKGAVEKLGKEVPRERTLRSSFQRGTTTLHDLPRLPCAGIETTMVARSFPTSRIFSGGRGEADLSSLVARDRLRDFDVIHLVGHTLSDMIPERCALALSEQDASPGALDDGLLETGEILLGWDIDARLLTLSGCATARAAGVTRGEDKGFTPAVFASGARNVLVSLYTVDDRATAILMDRFYENLTGRYTGVRGGATGPLPAVRALREAKIHVRDLVDAAGRRPYEHPAYWAGFILLGLP